MLNDCIVLAAMSKMRVVLIDPGFKVNGHYYWVILLYEQMLSAIKHVLADTGTTDVQHSPTAAM